MQHPKLSRLALWLYWLPLLAIGEQITFNQGVFFQIQAKQEQTQPSYLFGTLHSEDPQALKLNPIILQAFNQADHFAMEVVPDSETLFKSMIGFSLPAGKQLQTMLDPELYHQVREATQPLGLSAQNLNQLKPWAIVTLLSVPPPVTGQYLDLVLYQKAFTQHKTIHGLESIDEQLAVFDQLSEQEQIALLQDVVQHRYAFSLIHQQLLAAYMRLDLQEIARLTSHYFRGNSQELNQHVTQITVQQRNLRMLERLIPLVNTGNAFIAVNALHLSGTEGLLHLLADQGYQIKRLY